MATTPKTKVIRSDAWTKEDDDELIRLVLHHIRIGSTQLKGFDAAAHSLGRTPAACGFRWNGVLRKLCRDDIAAARRDRKNGKVNQETEVQEESITRQAIAPSGAMRDVCHYLQSFDEHYQELRRRLWQIQQERDSLLERVTALETELSKSVSNGTRPAISPEQLHQDSETLLAIMERARQLLK